MSIHHEIWKGSAGLDTILIQRSEKERKGKGGKQKAAKDADAKALSDTPFDWSALSSLGNGAAEGIFASSNEERRRFETKFSLYTNL